MASDWVSPADSKGPQRFVCLVVEPNGDRSSHSSLYHVLPYNGNPLALSSAKSGRYGRPSGKFLSGLDKRRIDREWLLRGPVLAAHNGHE